VRTKFELKLHRLILNGGLAGPGASAEDVADALRVPYLEFRRQKRGPFVASVRRALTSIPIPSPSSSDSSDDGSSGSRRRGHHDAHATTASSSTSVSDAVAHPSPPAPAYDVTKSMLRSQYAAQTPKRGQQLEIEVAAEKLRRLITADGGGGGDAKPEAAPSSEGFGRGEVISRVSGMFCW
jgi:ribosome biogenesis ATPase